MKSLLKLFWILGVSLIALSFTACSDDDDPKSTESALTEMTFDDDIVSVQPVITGTDIKFYVAYDATEEDLKEMVPTITISSKATVSPASGSKVDFSGDPVKFTVTAEDGTTMTVYTASYQIMNKYDFEEWVEGNPDAGEKVEKYYQPVGSWNSSNAGALMIKNLYGFTDRMVVTQSDETNAYSGKSAARIETLDTKGQEGFLTIIPNIPKITTGSLFLGDFDILSAMKNTLTATKFGIPHSGKPLEIKGYYKYTPGDEFYRAAGQADCHKPVLEEGTIDQCAINAILYEIDDENSPYITGVDTYDFDKNAKLVAIAQLADGTAKANYTPFSIEMDYKKPYDPTKKYRFAIICSSSAEGDTFSGAPGSVLFVDDIEVISE